MTLHSERLSADIDVVGGQRVLVLRATDLDAFEGFEGRRFDAADNRIIEGPLSETNAAALRREFTHLQPRPLGTGTSAGVGDRLGLATPGQAAAFARHGRGVTPVFAQQSIREMDRLGRSPRAVLDDATFGCVIAGWTGRVGADLDHIRDVADIDRGIDAGFTTFTLDPGDGVRNVASSAVEAAVTATNWSVLEDDIEAVLRRYAGVTVGLDTGSFTPSEQEVKRAVAKYGDAVALTAQMSRHLASRNPNAYEIEVAVDETAVETTLFEHHYLATELARLGVRWVSMAPRYSDGFEKGLDFIGDKPTLIENFAGHHAVAQLHGGYKISMHTGSDKFSVYPQLVEATAGRIHLKTSGTSWLTALAVIARREPALLREIYRLSLESYVDARASYQVSADAERAPRLDAVSDGELEEIVSLPDSRQILHVGYGAVLTATDDAGHRRMDADIREVLLTHRDEYALRLESHIGRHLTAFSEGAVS